jgi:hypothetical protein
VFRCACYPAHQNPKSAINETVAVASVAGYRARDKAPNAAIAGNSDCWLRLVCFARTSMDSVCHRSRRQLLGCRRKDGARDDLTVSEFRGRFEINNINRIEDVGSQLLPINA